MVGHMHATFPVGGWDLDNTVDFSTFSGSIRTAIPPTRTSRSVVIRIQQLAADLLNITLPMENEDEPEDEDGGYDEPTLPPASTGSVIRSNPRRDASSRAQDEMQLPKDISAVCQPPSFVCFGWILIDTLIVRCLRS
jgi:hypothetical protein